MKLKKANGITLIALVITIIIMLTLAGVTIHSVSTNNFAEKAENSVYSADKASKTEEIYLKIYKTKLKNNGKITNKDLEEILKEYGDVITDSNGNITGVKTEQYDIISLNDM